MNAAGAAAIAALIAGIAIGGGVQQIRVSRAQAAAAESAEQFAGYRASQSKALADVQAQARAAEQDATAREHALQVTIETKYTEARNAQKQFQTDLASARADVDRLRNQAATAVARARVAERHATDSTPAAAGQRKDESSADPAGVLADMLASNASRLVEVSGYADEMRAAGLQCEAAYGAARAELAR